MGSLSNESFDEFLDSLKQAGVAISNERELRERLAEAQRWRYAFATLASNGRSLGIRFQDASSGANESRAAACSEHDECAFACEPSCLPDQVKSLSLDRFFTLYFTKIWPVVGVWRSLVARTVRDGEVVRSNRITPTNSTVLHSRSIFE